MAKGPAIRGGQTSRKREQPAVRGARGDTEPWLDEAAYDDDSPVHTLIGRRALAGLLLVAGLLAIGIVVGILLVARRDSTPIDVPAVGEPIPVLTAKGPWKVAPDGEPGADGIPVEGQGQTLYGTGDGQPTDARIALDALPETPLPKPGTAVAEAGTEVIRLPSPVDGTGQAPAPAADTANAGGPASGALAMPKVQEALRGASSAPPAAPASAPAGAGGAVVQLGAFSTEARARAAFRQLAGRFSYLAGLEPLILPVASEGRTLYRLRASAAGPDAASDICARLKVAGEACSVVH